MEYYIKKIIKSKSIITLFTFKPGYIFNIDCDIITMVI